MNLLQMEYFQEVAKTSSITQAARTLNISQSALSIMMNKLEAEIDYEVVPIRKLVSIQLECGLLVGKYLHDNKVELK